MKFLVGFIFGILCAGGIAWFVFLKENPSQEGNRSDQLAERSSQVWEAAGQKARELGETAKEKIDELDLDPEDIKNELKQTGKAVRQKAEEIGEAVVDSAADARVTATIKTKLAMEDKSLAWKVSVDTHDGHVTLSGTVQSAAEIEKALTIAKEVKGVVEVTSKLKVKEEKE